MTLLDETRPVHDTRAEPSAPPRRWLGFFVVPAAMIMNLLDSTIVNVAAPAIQRDLSLSTSRGHPRRWSRPACCKVSPRPC